MVKIQGFGVIFLRILNLRTLKKLFLGFGANPKDVKKLSNFQPILVIFRTSRLKIAHFSPILDRMQKCGTGLLGIDLAKATKAGYTDVIGVDGSPLSIAQDPYTARVRDAFLLEVCKQKGVYKSLFHSTSVLLAPKPQTISMTSI